MVDITNLSIEQINPEASHLLGSKYSKTLIPFCRSLDRRIAILSIIWNNGLRVKKFHGYLRWPNAHEGD